MSQMLRDGRENVTDDVRSEQPATSRGDATVGRVRELLNADRRISVQLLGDTKHL